MNDRRHHHYHHLEHGELKGRELPSKEREIPLVDGSDASCQGKGSGQR